MSWAESSSHFRSEADPVAIAIHNVRLLDGSGQAIERATVIVQGKRIHAAGPSRTVNIPRGASRIDGRGLTLLPALIDCHVHFCLGAEPDVVGAIEQETPSETLLKAAQSARQTLEAGVTTVRDVGSRDHSIFLLKQAIDGPLWMKRPARDERLRRMRMEQRG
jgi:imidazolonepropionase-like amidohydrolase